MRRILILVTGLFFLSAILLFGNAGETRPINSRIHKQYIADDGQIFDYTQLLFSPINKDNPHSSEEIFLMDLRENGLWVIDEIMTHLPEEPIMEGSCEMRNLSTRETLKIIFTKGEYLVIANNKDKYIVAWNKIPDVTKDFLPFVKEHFSEVFLNGLNFLRKQAFSPLTSLFSSFWFIPIWSMEASLDTNVKLQKALIFDKLLPPNCDFDAKFGYPCSKDEVPAKNPRVLIVEQK